MRNKNYSDYVIYVDESGDHGLASINIHYPIFVLVFCIFKKDEYINKICPSVQELKFRFFGHDSVILHASDIRKSKGEFTKFSREQKNEFLHSLSSMVKELDFLAIPTIIDKNELKRKHIEPENPYEIALRLCMEHAYNFLEINQQHKLTTHIIIEKRGKQEDNDLELAFRRIIQGDNFRDNYFKGLNLPFEMIFADKKINSIGLQLADLVAHPIGNNFLKPNQNNQAYEVVQEKIYKGENAIKILP